MFFIHFWAWNNFRGTLKELNQINPILSPIVEHAK
jgi:hypothetical protein